MLFPRIQSVIIILFIILLPCFSIAQNIVLFAGDGPSNTVPAGPNYNGDSVLAIHSSLSYMGNVAFDTSGNVYIADNLNNRIRKVDPAGIISTFLKGYQTECIVFDKSMNLYFEIGTQILKRDISGAITTFAGNGTGTYTGDGGPATAAGLLNPEGMVFDTGGNMFFADLQHNVVRKINTAGIITTVAGNGYTIMGGTGGFSGDGGPATAAELSYPESLAFDSVGNLYIADVFNYRVRKVDRITGIITTVAGSGPIWPSTVVYSGEGGPATSATLCATGIAFDETGNLFVSDVFTERIFKINRSGIITTIAGNGTMDYSGDGGPASAAIFHNPDWISFDACGNMYISDDENNRIRKIIFNPPVVTPTITVSGPASALPGSTVTLTAIVSGSSTYTITWLKNGLLFSTTNIPTTTYIKGSGNDTISAIITDKVTKACFSNGSSPAITIHDPKLNVGFVFDNPIKIYPNPSDGILNIDNIESGATFRIANIIGSTILQGHLSEGNNILFLGKLVPGIYMVEVTENNGTKRIFRLLIEGK